MRLLAERQILIPILRQFVQRIAEFGNRLRAEIRLSPHDTTTEQSRASERHRRVALTAIASALAKVISVGTALISVPLTLHYLGAERYGLWMTISSLAAFLAFADLGIGNGMLNAIAAAYGRDDRDAIRGYVSSGFVVLSTVAAALLLLFAAAYSFVPWPALFNVKTELACAEVGPAVAVFFTCFALAIPLTIAQRVQSALQRGFLSGLWQCASSTLGLIGVIVAIHYQASLPWLVLAFVGAPLLISILNSLSFFVRMQLTEHRFKRRLRKYGASGPVSRQWTQYCVPHIGSFRLRRHEVEILIP